MTNPPNILIGKSDYAVLAHLASAGSGTADELQIELDRAKIVDDDTLPANVVRMGSTVGYCMDGGEPTTVTLVYPAEADIAQGRVSVLTPIGTALVGLAPGQSIDWLTRDGKTRQLTIITVFSGHGSGNPKPASPSPTDLGRDLPDDPGPSAA